MGSRVFGKPSMALQVHKLYMVGLVFPRVINDPAPIRPPHLSGEWLRSDLDASARNVRSIRRHLGLVLRYDDRLKLAVILLGSSQPRRAHRFVPWFGTPRLDYQPREVLMPTPLRKFIGWPGYLNFSHAMRVSVLQDDEVVMRMSPGLSYFHPVSQGGQVQDVSVAPDQVDMLHTLHSLYWEGKRYHADGSLRGSVDGDYGDDYGMTMDESFGLPVARDLPSFVSEAIPGDEDIEVTDPMDPKTGMRSSEAFVLAMQEEDMRATQVELLDEEMDLGDIPTPEIYGIFKPLIGFEDDGLSSYQQLADPA